ncbi:hypothetical protein WJX72_002907 [[Myrmecia] bisecta]|uniref:Protein TIC 20 n=1 Tax=[Myrmecia] bisecta TaxID=41462 RepID=A0AAW1QPT0_9CHLO
MIASPSPLLWGACSAKLRTASSAISPVSRSCRSRSVTVFAQSKPDIPDRVIAALPYLIPLFDGLRYGKFFFMNYPAFAQILAPLGPAIRLYFSFPFASLIVFFAVYAGIVNNTNFDRYVRYNAMQAVLLSIILIVPGLLESVLKPSLSGPGLPIYINAYNTIWLFVFTCVAYGIGSCLVGTTARLPLIADAADQQIR